MRTDALHVVRMFAADALKRMRIQSVPVTLVSPTP
jgi:hypothetical protein